ncbi:ANTAR domain-containing protein [Streptomyces sp. NPDC059629]|uniref:ANTAR domain-containing protein n=1 Tax=Streptomyces sp. NPDC059629 TaxID=3346889 RepID=UPI00367746AD
MALQSEIGALQREIGQLQDSVVSQAVIDQAIGLIPVLGGLRPHQGIEVLMAVPERTGLSVRVIAGQIVG